MPPKRRHRHGALADIRHNNLKLRCFPCSAQVGTNDAVVSCMDTNVGPACSPTLPARPTVGSPNAVSARGTALATAGSVLSAFLASACCVGPLIFALLGLGGGALLVKFEPYRPYFIAITFALLGTGFYFTYRRPRLASATVGADGAACDCPAPRTNRAGRIMLWVATVLVVGFLVFPYLVPYLFS